MKFLGISFQAGPRSTVLFLFLLMMGVLAAGAVTGYRVSQVNPAGATVAYASALNKSNVVVGNFTNSAGTVQGFKLAGNKYTTIKFPTANNFTRANGINDSNLIVGNFFGTDNFYHGFTLSNGKYTQYDINKGVVSTSIFGVNNRCEQQG